MSKSINLPFKPSVPLREQCSHGKTWDEFCRDCRIVWLEHGMEDRERQLRRDRAELEQLRAAAETCAAPDPAPAGCEEWWHLKPYGYAPGGYTMKCPHCQVTVWHVDKRARCCKQCAIAFYESAQSAQNRSPEHG